MEIDHREIEALNNVLVNEIAAQYFARTALALTNEEVFAAFVRSEHEASLRLVEDLVGGVNYNSVVESCSYSGGNSIPLMFSFHTAPVIFPKYVKLGMVLTCPEDLKAKIQSWLDGRVHIGKQLLCVANAITTLMFSQQCGNRRALATMVPVYPALLSKAADLAASSITRIDRSLPTEKVLRQWVKQAVSGSMGKLPPVRPEQRMQYYDASAIVSALSLASDAPGVQSPKGGMVVQVYPVSSMADAVQRGYI